jgi:hypothetical protein
MAIITLITDFGTSDGYVGAMKGVIVRLAGSLPGPAIPAIPVIIERGMARGLILWA